jgi:endonuclease YncB( thermonuclease family)
MGICWASYKYGKCTTENTPIHTFDGEKRYVKVVDVYDGDTVWIATTAIGSSQVFRYRARLVGINAPELKPSLSKANRAVEIEAAQKSRDTLKAMVNGKIVYAHFKHEEKYGRLLCELFDNKGSVNKRMVSMGHAVEYMF